MIYQIFTQLNAMLNVQEGRDLYLRRMIASPLQNKTCLPPPGKRLKGLILHPHMALWSMRGCRFLLFLRRRRLLPLWRSELHLGTKVQWEGSENRVLHRWRSMYRFQLRYQMKSVHIWKETVGMWLALRASTGQLLLPNPVTPHQVLKQQKSQVLQKRRLLLQIQL